MMSRQLSELKSILEQLIAEQAKLLALLEAQYAAMKKIDVKSILELAHDQESTRLRMVSLEHRRRNLVRAIATSAKINEDPSITRLMELFPPYASDFGKLRDQLRGMIAKISHRTSMASKLSVAMLGHLNTAVRLVAGAIERAGVYTRAGTPRVANRIGVMEAIG
jgi:flagellar FlgN protein